MTIRRILGVRAKNLEAIILFIDFPKALDSILRGKIEQIFLVYGLPKETVTGTMMQYKNTKVKVRSPDRDTNYFDIVEGVLQGDTLAPYLFIICIDYVLRTSVDERKRFQAVKGKKQKIPRTNNYGLGLRRWHSASGKYTHPNQNPATYSGTSSWWHRPPCQRTRDGIYAF